MTAVFSKKNNIKTLSAAVMNSALKVKITGLDMIKTETMKLTAVTEKYQLTIYYKYKWKESKHFISVQRNSYNVPLHHI